MNTMGMKSALTCLVTLTIFIMPIQAVAAFNLSADIIAVEGASRQTGKLYVKGNKYRVDLNGGSEYAIIRHDRNAAWMVLPEHKTYIEMPFDPKTKPAIEGRTSGQVKKKLIGNDVIDGHAVKKYEVTAARKGKADSFYQWITIDHDFPIKSSAADGAWSIEYRNIKVSVSDELFEIPQGYEKVAFDSLSSSDTVKLR